MVSMVFRKTALLALALVALTPAVAQAKPTAQPLVDLPPTQTHFKDRVLTSSKLTAHAAAAGDFIGYPTKEGTSVAVAISTGYGNLLSQTVAQSYVDFLDGLNHGPELSALRIVIAPP